MFFHKVSWNYSKAVFASKLHLPTNLQMIKKLVAFNFIYIALVWAVNMYFTTFYLIVIHLFLILPYYTFLGVGASAKEAYLIQLFH